MTLGSFIFVLHSHVPYVRKSGKWPHGEEMLFEIIAETYVPLLNAFETLYKEGISPNLSLGLTPILLEQLADSYMQEEFVKYIKQRIATAKNDKTTFKTSLPDAVPVADFYVDWYSKILNDYEHKYNRDLISAFKYFQDKGHLDILTSAATHGYLPLISRDSAIWGQLKTGIEQYKLYFGRKPTGIWLPECGYRPITSDLRIGIETFLDEMEIKYFFTDTHVIEGSVDSNSTQEPTLLAQPSSPYSTPRKPKRSRLDKQELPFNADSHSTFHPYFVEQSNVYVFGRDQLTGMQVWSAQWGYPGDFVYREFHKKAPSSGIQYWKISNQKPGLKFKEIYNPAEAMAQAEIHADHFTDLVASHLENYHNATNRKGVVVSSYDTELFGHWWFEGIHWIESVIRGFSQKKKVELVSAREYVERYPETLAVRLPESSWGNGGHHSTWLNAETEHLWDRIHEAEIKFEDLAKKYPNAKGLKLKLLNQAARELLLLQSSDWTFLITTVQARDYAEKRFDEHVERFNLLCDSIENNRAIDEKVTQIFDVDNVFKKINYKNFI